MAGKLQEVPFKNKIGQTIAPGDRVVAITTGYSGEVDDFSGVYVGTVNGHPSIMVERRVGGYWKNDGTKASWENRFDDGVGSYSYRTIPCRTTLRRDRIYKIA